MATMIDDPNPFDLDLDGFYERYLKTCAMWGITAVESRASRRARAGVERSPSRTARADAAVARGYLHVTRGSSACASAFYAVLNENRPEGRLSLIVGPAMGRRSGRCWSGQGMEWLAGIRRSLATRDPTSCRRLAKA